jgi:adenosine deaminase
MLGATDPDTLAFIRALPKTETHLHLEGALPWDLLRTLDPDRHRTPPSAWRDDYRFPSFARFDEELLRYAFAWFTSPERYYEAAKAVFARHLEQNVRYVECSFASGVLEFGGVDGEAVSEAIHSAVPTGITLRIFMGIHRNGWTDRSRPFLERCLEWKRLDGIDLHGYERIPLEAWTAEFWSQAREAGKHTKAHAGEFSGPESVREVLDTLHVQRIEHGVRSIEDPALVERLARGKIALDLCPISNLKLGVVPSLREHPIRSLIDAGVVCTVSTDDPIIFGNTLTQEYAVLASELGFSKRELAQVALNGFRIALCDPSVVAAEVTQLEGILADGKL